MKSLKFLLLTITLLAFSPFDCDAQTTKAKYTDYDRGYRFWYYDQWDSAFLMFDRYLDKPDDTLNKARAYKFMGEMQSQTGDVYGAEESLARALHTLNGKDTAHWEELVHVNNDLGNLVSDLKRYEDAIGFYNQAISFAKGDPFMMEVMNGKAVTYQKMGDYKSATVLYDSILGLNRENPSRLARIIDNRAKTKWMENPAYPALDEYHYALKIRTDSQYIEGLNASYAHLSDYHAATHRDSALWYAQKMYATARANQSPDDVLEALDKLILLAPSPAAKEQWYAVFKKLNDSLQLSRDTTRNRFALIRYDVQKSKADNLLLQQDITTQRLLMGGLALLAITGVAAIYAWNRKRRKRIQAESENAIRHSRLQTSQKVHDVVANGLYGIMNELEHRENIEPENLINKIERLYEQSRNISYDEMAAANVGLYDTQMHELLTGFATEHTRVIVVGNEPAFWAGITPLQKQQVYLVLNELMVNMRKHSQASQVSIVFKQDNQQALIRYKDDGIGIAAETIFGNGLKNTVNRIKSLGGELSFEKSEQAGVLITMRIPIEQRNT